MKEPQVDLDTLRGRILYRLMKLRLDPTPTSQAAGLSKTGLRNILEGKSKSPRAETLTGLARELRTPIAWLANREGPEEIDEGAREQRVADYQARFSPESYAEIVEAARSVVERKMSPEAHATLEAMDAARAQSNVRVPERQPQIPYRDDMPKDIEVLGGAQGGNDGSFFFNGEAIDRVRRPPGLANAKGVFALYVVNDSMEPRYFPGELIYASSTRPVANGDFVIIELFPDEGEEAGRGFVKQLVSRSNKITVRQFNPAETLEFDKREVKNIFRVFTNNDLYGV